MKRDIAIIGSGGLAREVEWLLQRINEAGGDWNILGFIDNQSGSRVIGDDTFITGQSQEVSVAFAMGSPQIRNKLYDVYKKNPHIFFPNLIDPSVKLSQTVKFGEGNIVCAGSILTVDMRIGNCNFINLNCTVGHDVVMHDFCIINPGSNISGNVTLKNRVNVGTGTKVIQGITIGENAVIGAGAVVVRDVPADVTVVGVPAKIR